MTIFCKIKCQSFNFICQALEKSLKFAYQSYRLKEYICFRIFLKMNFFWPICELVMFFKSSQILGGFHLKNNYHQHCMSPAVRLLTFLMRFSLELNLFERRAIKTDYFTLNCTGNAQRMADLSPGDSGGGVMENKVWY